MVIVLDCFSLGYAKLFSHKFTIYNIKVLLSQQNQSYYPLTLVHNLQGGENLLGGGGQGDDLRHGQENLWDEVNFEFQKKRQTSLL